MAIAVTNPSPDPGKGRYPGATKKAVLGKDRLVFFSGGKNRRDLMQCVMVKFLYSFIVVSLREDSPLSDRGWLWPDK